MQLGLSKRRALITGASKGIGLAIAQAFAREGSDLCLVSRSRERLSRVRDRILADSAVQVDILHQDLGTSEGVSAVAEACGDLDILVNNAGAIPQGNLLSVDEAAWRSAWDLKVYGYINMSREVYRKMRDRRSGVIVNVIGGAGERPNPSYIAGSTGNAGLMAFTRALGGESVDHGIRVVGVNPGTIETDRHIATLQNRAEHTFGDRNRWRELYADAPFGRLGMPEEVADVVVFLASDRASYINATVVTVDGGRMARLR